MYYAIKTNVCEAYREKKRIKRSPYKNRGYFWEKKNTHLRLELYGKEKERRVDKVNRGGMWVE